MYCLIWLAASLLLHYLNNTKLVPVKHEPGVDSRSIKTPEKLDAQLKYEPENYKKKKRKEKTSPPQKSLVPGVLMLKPASWSETISKQRLSPLPLSSLLAC